MTGYTPVAEQPETVVFAEAIIGGNFQKRISCVAEAAVWGLAGGCALASILCLAVIAVSVMTGAAASVPCLFPTRMGQENGALAVEITPEWRGIVLIAVLAAAINTGLVAGAVPAIRPVLRTDTPDGLHSRA